MARKPKAETPDTPRLLVSREEAEKQIQQRIDLAAPMQRRKITDFDQLSDAQATFQLWDDFNRDMLRAMFSLPDLSAEYGYSVDTLSDPSAIVLDPHLEALSRALKEKVTRLKSIVHRLDFYLPSVTVAASLPDIKKELSRRVFVVHGRDDKLKIEVARLLEQLDLEPIILHEQTNQGRTIIEKFEDHSDVGFAIALLTPDDVGGLSGTQTPDLKPRARQNVILELGYFVGKLSRKKVCALYKAPTEVPSDFAGVVYTPVDDHGGWRYQLAKELKAAGYAIDLNKIH